MSLKEYYTRKLEHKIHTIDCKTTIKETIKDIVSTKEVSDAFYVFDLCNLVDNIKMWQKKLPRVKPFYTVKCNDHDFVLQALAAFDINFNCASKTEMISVLKLNVSPSRILFGNRVKLFPDIKFAMNQHVDLTIIDTKLELYKMKALYPSSGVIINICCDTELKHDNKPGCEPETEAISFLTLARTLGLSVVGVRFHIGVCGNKVEAFNKGIDASAKLFNKAKEMGFNMYLVNIGEGFYEDKETLLNDIIDVVNNALDKYFPPENNVTIIAEPGTSFVSSAFTLAAKICSLKKIVAGKDHMKYIINDGIYSSFTGVINGHKVFVPIPLNDYPESPVVQSSIWGPSGEDSDRIVESVDLPLMKINDWFIFNNMGAYTVPTSCKFNGSPIPKVFTVANHSIWDTLKTSTQLTENNFTTQTVAEAIIAIREALAYQDGIFDEDDDDFYNVGLTSNE